MNETEIQGSFNSTLHQIEGKKKTQNNLKTGYLKLSSQTRKKNKRGWRKPMRFTENQKKNQEKGTER